MLIIPAIDLKNGQCVRLKQGKFDDVDVFSDSPVETAKKWAAMGCERLHLVDLDGALEGSPMNHQAIANITKALPELPIQIGGGIRDLATIETYLGLGVQYCIIGTKAVQNPEFVTEACQAFPGHIIVGMDARDGKLAIKGWEEQSNVSAVELGKTFASAGVSAIVYTDIAKDGMMGGVNIEATADLAKQTGIPVIASGGVHKLEDISALLPYETDGVSGVITGRAIYEGTLDLPAAIALTQSQKGQS
jgi:phosphoribosylformimino-5-aminoimidazole carboxamide ribotide isomerase